MGHCLLIRVWMQSLQNNDGSHFLPALQDREAGRTKESHDMANIRRGTHRRAAGKEQSGAGAGGGGGGYNGTMEETTNLLGFPVCRGWTVCAHRGGNVQLLYFSRHCIAFWSFFVVYEGGWLMLSCSGDVEGGNTNMSETSRVCGESWQPSEQHEGQPLLAISAARAQKYIGSFVFR